MKTQQKEQKKGEEDGDERQVSIKAEKMNDKEEEEDNDEGFING